MRYYERLNYFVYILMGGFMLNLLFDYYWMMLIGLSAAQCDFESGSCGWYELVQDDGFEWVRGSANGVAVDYPDQTPPQDHSTNTSAGEYT